VNDFSGGGGGQTGGPRGDGKGPGGGADPTGGGFSFDDSGGGRWPPSVNTRVLFFFFFFFFPKKIFPLGDMFGRGKKKRGGGGAFLPQVFEGGSGRKTFTGGLGVSARAGGDFERGGGVARCGSRGARATRRMGKKKICFSPALLLGGKKKTKTAFKRGGVQ